MNPLIVPTVVLLIAGVVSFAASFPVKTDAMRDRYWVLTQAAWFLAAVCGIIGMTLGG